MLNRLDDFPIHQTVGPIAHPGMTNRNACDRFRFRIAKFHVRQVTSVSGALIGETK